MCVCEDIFGESSQKASNRRKVKPQALRAGGAPHAAAIIIAIADTNATAHAVITISIITINNFLLDFVAPFRGSGSPCCRPRLQRAVPRPGQPHGEGALGPGGAKKIQPDKLILVAFVI